MATPPLADAVWKLSTRYNCTFCKTDDCRQKNYIIKKLFLLKNKTNIIIIYARTCSLVLITSNGQVTMVPTAPASLQGGQKLLQLFFRSETFQDAITHPPASRLVTGSVIFFSCYLVFCANNSRYRNVT